MTAVSDVFQRTVAQSRMAFMPFVTAGDPDTETTAAVLLALRDAKVDLVELGFPYSDPIADGPVIQASYTRALQNGITVEKIFGMMAGLKGQGLPPVLAMVSFAIIFRHGNSRFIREAAEAGFSGLIIPDLPADEAEEILAAAKGSGLDLIQLIAPQQQRAAPVRFWKHRPDFCTVFRWPARPVCVVSCLRNCSISSAVCGRSRSCPWQSDSGSVVPSMWRIWIPWPTV